MSKKSRFRRPFDKQHGKRPQTLLKSPRQHLYHIYSSLWRKLNWKKSLWVICKMLGLLLNTLTAVDMYSLLNREHITEPFQMQLSKKEIFFLNFFMHSSNLDPILNISKKGMTIMVYVLPKQNTAKDLVRQMF